MADSAPMNCNACGKATAYHFRGSCDGECPRMRRPSSLPTAMVAPAITERTEPVNIVEVQSLTRQLLVALGYDPDDPGIVDTPRRVAAMWGEFLDYDPGKLATQFDSVTHDQMVVVSGMRVWSMCEHHLLPFWCDVSVAYLSKAKVLGLSKLGRIAHKHAHRLQLQERLVTGIADEMAAMLGHEDVAVIATGEHLCMTMRGIQTPHRMTSSDIRGAFMEPAARAEFLALSTR